jgi:predicted short-subunit dehydrogenase-like oxidoreductase (DUF2520 family)
MKSTRIVMFGAGNVAIHLTLALWKAGYQIVQVYSRSEESAKFLADQVKAIPITNPSDFDNSSDAIIFSLNDNALCDIIEQVDISGQLALHTSGTIPMEVFKGKADHYGVLYPLQTFSKFREIKFLDVPLFIEANSPTELSNLKMLASSIAAKVILADSLQRRQLHLSAVFASNFVNHMYALTLELGKKFGFTFDVFEPIILETTLKAIESGNPMDAQTGPAVRKNREIVLKHIEMLSPDPDLQKLYTSLTNSILKLHFKDTFIL